MTRIETDGHGTLNALNVIQFPRFTRNDRVYYVNDSDFLLRSKLKRSERSRAQRGNLYVMDTLNTRI